MRTGYMPGRYLQQRLLPQGSSYCALTGCFLSLRVTSGWRKMFLQYQGNGPTQACHETFRRPDARRFSHQDASRHFRFDHGTEAMPLARNITYDHDLFRSYAGDDHAHAAADGARHSFQSTDREGIAGLSERKQILKARTVSRGGRFVVIANRGSIGGIDFPAAMSAAGT